MTFLAPLQAAGPSFAFFRKASKVDGPRRLVDEDGARRAMGVDTRTPLVSLPGTSLEHLARIALG